MGKGWSIDCKHPRNFHHVVIQYEGAGIISQMQTCRRIINFSNPKPNLLLTPTQSDDRIEPRDHLLYNSEEGEKVGFYFN